MLGTSLTPLNFHHVCIVVQSANSSFRNGGFERLPTTSAWVALTIRFRFVSEILSRSQSTNLLTPR